MINGVGDRAFTRESVVGQRRGCRKCIKDGELRFHCSIDVAALGPTLDSSDWQLCVMEKRLAIH